MKKGLKGMGFFTEYRKVEGVLGKNASPLPPPRWENRGGAGGSPVWPNPAAKGPRRLRGKGKRRWGLGGFDSRPWLRPRWPEVA